MTALVLAAVLAFSPPVKYLNLDDFTVGAYTKTLVINQSDYHVVLGLDKAHCLFGERQTQLAINSNPNDTSITLAVGNGQQQLSSPDQIAWEYSLEYGGDGFVDLNLFNVDKFFVDFNGNLGLSIPDLMTLEVRDQHAVGGTVSWGIREGGVYFRRSAFQESIDWHHIVYFRLKQNFTHIPNPTLYSVTAFYASTTPGLSPGEKLDPTSIGH